MLFVLLLIFLTYQWILVYYFWFLIWITKKQLDILKMYLFCVWCLCLGWKRLKVFLNDVEIGFVFVIKTVLYTCISDWLFMWDLSLTALDLSCALSQVNYASSCRIMCLSYWQIDRKRFQLFCRCNRRVFVSSKCILQHLGKEQRKLLNLRNCWYIR